MNVHRLQSRGVLTFGIIALAMCTACARKAEPAPAETAPPPLPSPPPVETVASVKPPDPPPAPPPELPIPGPEAVAAGAKGTLKIEPNPVRVCEKTGLGLATVKWTLSGTKYAEIHVGSPTGNLFASIKAPGAQKTGQWITKGTAFYLQNGSDGRAENTIARVIPDVAPGGPCPP